MNESLANQTTDSDKDGSLATKNKTKHEFNLLNCFIIFIFVD